MPDIQLASVWKRISAFLFDLILFSVLTVLFAWAVSAVTGYDARNDRLQKCYKRIQNEYGTDLMITNAEYELLSDEEKEVFSAAADALNHDDEALEAYENVMRLTVVITSLGILLSLLCLEFAVPLFLKDGRTLGKKIFGLAVMRTEGIRVSAVSLFIRALLGKYALETMIPVIIALMIYFNAIGLLGAVLLLLILVIQTALVFLTRLHTPIHDLLSDTFVVDYASQRIFENREDLIRFKEDLHRKQSSSASL